MKKELIKRMAIAAMAVITVFSMATCDEDKADNAGKVVAILSVTADGSSMQTTTQLTLTFDKEIVGLSSADITLSGISGVNKGTLSGSNPYTLPISGFTSGGTLNVAVAKSGYDIYSSPKTVGIYYTIPVIFNSVTANGSTTQTTTQLTLTFDKAIDGLTATDITLSGVSGVSKGTLSGSNPYTLPISGFSSGGTLNVAVSKSSVYTNYTISGSSKTVGIYYFYQLVVEMIQIPGGSFLMGSNNANGASPPHTVTLSSFYMSKYEVTQEQWAAVMGNNPSKFTDSPASGEVQQKRPVETVSWYDALVFCNKLSMLEGLSPAYYIYGSTDPAKWGTVPTYGTLEWNSVGIVAGSTGYRLPTEAQWEYAARGGNGSPGNYTYSGSDTVDDVAWYKGNSGDKTHEVGNKAPNGLGLYDMTGNVFEWCWDWSESYSSEAQTDPMGGVYGPSLSKVNCGGGWSDSSIFTPSSSRNNNDPSSRSFNRGFRLVRP